MAWSESREAGKKVSDELGCRGVGLVNVMGRQSGFIAMMASMASGVVDCCLIPENKFNVDKLTAHIESVISKQGHCVICIAEGAGQVRQSCLSSMCSAVVQPVPYRALLIAGTSPGSWRRHRC